jgi:uncharacterized protein with PQ loop repeat
MYEHLGVIGSIILTISGLPQVVKTIKDGHADELSFIGLLCSFIGASVLVLVLYHDNLKTLLVGYLFGLITTSVHIFYKLKKKKSSSCFQKQGKK